MSNWIDTIGVYLGAIGSIAVAVISYKALLDNKRQLDYIKKQNNPEIIPSLRIVLGKDFLKYYLVLENKGIGLAKEVRATLSMANNVNINNAALTQHLNAINNRATTLPARESQYFLIYDSPRGEKLKQLNDNTQEYFSKLQKILEECAFQVHITYLSNFDKCEKDVILNMKDAFYEETKIVQMLDYIDDSLKELNKSIEKLGNKDNNKQLNN